MPSTSKSLHQDHTTPPTFSTNPTHPTPSSLPRPSEATSAGGAPKPSKPSKKPLSLKNLPDLMTVREVADVLRVSPLTIKRWGKKGNLPFVRINSRGDRRYSKDAVLWKLGITPQSD